MLMEKKKTVGDYSMFILLKSSKYTTAETYSCLKIVKWNNCFLFINEAGSYSIT